MVEFIYTTGTELWNTMISISKMLSNKVDFLGTELSIISIVFGAGLTLYLTAAIIKWVIGIIT